MCGIDSYSVLCSVVRWCPLDPSGGPIGANGGDDGTCRKRGSIMHVPLKLCFIKRFPNSISAFE